MATTTKKYTRSTEYHEKEFADRLTVFRQQYVDKSQTEAAKKLGVSQTGLWYMEHHQAPIKFEFISKLVKEYGLNQEWFSTGKGKPQAAAAAKANLITDLGALATEIELLKKYVKIMEVNQNHFIKLIERQGKQIEELEAKINKK
jgi:transcriptional regulator with XRE-family HTH domain